MITGLNVRSLRLAFRPVAIAGLMLLIFSQGCELPRGCGPGDIPSNPLSSNLIDYTYPASGAVVKGEDLTVLEVGFLQPINKDTFSVDDDLRFFQIKNRLTPHPEVFELTDYIHYFFNSTVQYPDECHNSSTCDRLFLTFKPEPFEQSDYYRIRFRGVEPADPEDPGPYIDDYVSSPSSEGDVELAHDVDVIIGIARTVNVPPDLPDIPNPIIPCDISPDTGECYVRPHSIVMFVFNTIMGFVRFEINPTPGGFHFGVSHGSLTLGDASRVATNSIQGLEPGERFVIDFPRAEPEHTEGIPQTVDIFGRKLKSSRQYEFKTSHIRIISPRHEPFTGTPGPVRNKWYETGFAVVVETTEDVALISGSGPEGKYTGDAFFLDKNPSPPDPNNPKGNSITSLTISNIMKGAPGCSTELEVHAYGTGGEYLGSDSIEGYVYPPTDRLTMISYNMWGTNRLLIFEECVDNPILCKPNIKGEFDPTLWPGLPYKAGWKTRISMFANEVIAEHKPAIIAIQEISRISQGCITGSGCENTEPGEQLQYIVSKFNEVSDRIDPTGCGPEYVAAAYVDSGKKILFGGATVNAGEVIVYDRRQIQHIDAFWLKDRYGEYPNGACMEYIWDGPSSVRMRNDCLSRDELPQGLADSETTRHVTAVSRVIFEFPLWSGRFFDFYNTHATTSDHFWPIHWREHIFPWLLERHSYLEADLLDYYLPKFERDNSWGMIKRENILTYPPMFAGDFNQAYEPPLVDDEWPRPDHFSEVFWNSPSHVIDKVLVGDAEFFEDDELGFDRPYDERDSICGGLYNPFVCRQLGYFVGYVEAGHYYNPYSDHSPAMVMTRAKDIDE